MTIPISRLDDKAQVRLGPALNIYCAMEAKAQLLAALVDSNQIEIDLADLEDLDTAGVQLLLLLKLEAQRQQKDCVFINHGAAVRDVIDLLNLAGALGDPVVIPA